VTATSILIVDDHALIRLGLVQLIGAEKDMTVAGEAGSAEELLNHPALPAVDVVLLDISLGHGDNGLVLIDPIRVRNPRARILVLSIHAEEHFAVRVLRAGANGYMQKNDAAPELIRAIRCIAGGQTYVSQWLGENFAIGNTGTENAAPHERLSPREFEVFLLIASGLAVSQIAEKIGVSVNTVSTHRQRILQKMNMTNNASVMYYAIQRGLVS
jgi:two-component system invasion response regulator UvrY